MWKRLNRAGWTGYTRFLAAFLLGFLATSTGVAANSNPTSQLSILCYAAWAVFITAACVALLDRRKMILVVFILQVVFFVLKITGAIHWTWPAVLTPLWVVLVVGLVKLALCVLVDILERLDRRSRRKSRKVRGW